MDTEQTIPELLEQNKDRVTISVEILPPVRGNGIDSIFKIIDDIKVANPLWIDVTSHSSNVEWISSDKDDITFMKNKRRRSPGTIAICAAIKYKYNIVPVPHLLCQGFSREETEDALIDLEYLGVNNILVIRGDDHGLEAKSTFHGSNTSSLELLEQTLAMNQGKYLDQTAQPTNFCVGVGCYPEKHIEAPNVEASDDFLLQKQELGAHYAVSQMFYDNQHYYDFIDRIESKIKIPVVPAMKIMTSEKQLTSLPKNFYINIPQELVEQMQAAKDKMACHQVGIDWTYRQCVDLIEKGHNHLHFYIMRKTDHFLTLIKMLDRDYGVIK